MQFLARTAFASVAETLGRPPWRPRARAAAKPALARFLISQRSDYARAEKMLKISSPEAKVASITFSLIGWKPMPFLSRSSTSVIRGPHGPSQAIQLPDNEEVAGLERGKALRQTGPVGFRSRQFVHEDGRRGIALLRQGVDLLAQVLAIRGNARVADQARN